MNIFAAKLSHGIPPISLVGNLKELQNHPRTEDNLRVIKMWEEAKLQGVLTDKQKELLKKSRTRISSDER